MTGSTSRSSNEAEAQYLTYTLVELGSGSSEKTRLILDALPGAGHLRRYVPVDVSAAALEGALADLAAAYPDQELHGVVADLDQHLDDLPSEGRRMVAILGSTIGNLEPAARHEFLTSVRKGLGPVGTLLLGTDLVKDIGRLFAAYDDSDGVTAEFNRNVLHVLNRELGADFDPTGYDHAARWNPDEERMEMWLRSRSDQRVNVSELDLEVFFAAGRRCEPRPRQSSARTGSGPSSPRRVSRRSGPGPTRTVTSPSRFRVPRAEAGRRPPCSAGCDEDVADVGIGAVARIEALTTRE